jgi:hypothetical protein
MDKILGGTLAVLVALLAIMFLFGTLTVRVYREEPKHEDTKYRILMLEDGKLLRVEETPHTVYRATAQEKKE